MHLATAACRWTSTVDLLFTQTAGLKWVQASIASNHQSNGNMNIYKLQRQLTCVEQQGSNWLLIDSSVSLQSRCSAPSRVLNEDKQREIAAELKDQGKNYIINSRSLPSVAPPLGHKRNSF
jgi:hypothetical protein